MASVNQTLKRLILRFQSGDIPEPVVAPSIFPIPNIPSASWGMRNKLRMYGAGTYDARGVRQWREAGRRIKKWAKPFHIIVPRIVTHQNGEGKGAGMPGRYILCPVFRVQDTVGAPIEYELPELPELPLIERAREWGIAVHALPPGPYGFRGCFDQERKFIVITSPAPHIYLHELSHVALGRLLGKLEAGVDWKEEVTAELSATVLCMMVAKTTKYLGNNFRFISAFANKLNLTPAEACWEVLNDCEKVIRLILQNDRKSGQRQQALRGKILLPEGSNFSTRR